MKKKTSNNEIEIVLTMSDCVKEFIDAIKQEIKHPYTVINTDSPECVDIEVFYKGKKITNAASIELNGCEMKFDDDKKIITNWRDELEEEES